MDSLKYHSRTHPQQKLVREKKNKDHFYFKYIRISLRKKPRGLKSEKIEYFFGPLKKNYLLVLNVQFPLKRMKLSARWSVLFVIKVDKIQEGIYSYY